MKSVLKDQTADTLEQAAKLADDYAKWGFNCAQLAEALRRLAETMKEPV